MQQRGRGVSIELVMQGVHTYSRGFLVQRLNESLFYLHKEGAYPEQQRLLAWPEASLAFLLRGKATP